MKAQKEAYKALHDAWLAGDEAYALEMSRGYLRDFPHSGFGWLTQGILLCGMFRYDEAEQVLHSAIQELSPDHLHLGYIHLGHVWRDRGDAAEAEKWYRKALDLEPDEAAYHVFLGACLHKKGDFAAAEGAYRRGTQCSKGPVHEAYHNLGLALRAQERYEEALACFDKAIELDPEYSIAIAAKSDVEKTIAYLSRIEQQT